MEFENFNVRQTRDVFDILGDTFKYIRTFWKSLLKMTAVYVLAPLLAGSLLFAVVFGDIFSGAFLSPADIEDSAILESGLMLFGAFFLIMISYLLLYGVICQHLKFAGKGKIPLDITYFSKGMFYKVLKLIFIFMLISFIFFLFFVFMPAIFFAIISAQASIFVPVIAAFGIILITIYIFVKLMVFPVALFVRDAGGLESLGISWRLTDGYFWQTFGLYLLITIVFGILSQLISTPLMLINMIAGAGVGEAAGGFMDFVSVTLVTLSFVFQVLFFGAQSIAVGLHYFNLEERKEGHTMGEQINQLAPDAP